MNGFVHNNIRVALSQRLKCTDVPREKFYTFNFFKFTEIVLFGGYNMCKYAIVLVVLLRTN
jgi:hypothetical protein